jgi:hypothetical protein
MKTILAAILGGIVVFVWNAVSWMALDWHEPTIRRFNAPEQMTQALVEQAPSSGIYVLNYPQATQAPPPAATADGETASPSAEATDAGAASAAAAPAAGAPFAFVAFTRDGVDADQMARQFAYSLAANILAALLIVFLIRATNDLSFFERFVFMFTVAVVIAVAGRLPNWIWWHYPRDFMVVDIADVLIGWSLAALIMAALTGPESSRPGLSYRRVRM